MIDPNEVSRSLIGAVLLAKRDVTGYQYFNQTVDGFWRSFSAIVLIIPFYLLAIASETQITPASDSAEPVVRTGGYYLGSLITLLIDWIGFPIVMVFVARFLDLSNRYVPYIIAYNWSSVLIVAVITVPILLFNAGLMSAQAASVAYLLLLLPALYYRWYIAFTALGTTQLTAGGLVCLDFVLSLAINGTASQLLG